MATIVSIHQRLSHVRRVLGDRISFSPLDQPSPVIRLKWRVRAACTCSSITSGVFPCVLGVENQFGMTRDVAMGVWESGIRYRYRYVRRPGAGQA